MCVNDIIVQGAEPLFFLDYFATGRLKTDTAEAVIAGIAKGCEESGCALIGGETAEMPGMYADGDYDIAGFAVGAVNREDMITGDSIRVGDTVLGLASSGIHSNGFSLVRHVMKKANANYEDASPFESGKTLGQSLITPTRLYVKSILKALKKHKGAIHGMAHITGGGFTENIPRVLPKNCAVEMDCAAWTLPPLFQWLAKAGDLGINDLADTFNCGIGMIVICDAAQADALKASFESSGETVYEVGTIVERGAENAEGITLLNRETAWKF
jgi:phosphoribosylaminoimidazole synthetase